jgi:hypothetical protein
VTFNVLNRKVHYWASFVVALPLLAIIATGVLLQLKKQSTWIQPAEQRGTGTVPQVGLDRILEQAMLAPEAGVTGWDDIDKLDLRPSKGVGKVILHNGWEVQIDLGTGAVLQTAYRRSDLIESLHDGSFFGGDWTKLGLFLPAGVGLLLLWLGGMWMWWVPFSAKRRTRHKAIRHGRTVATSSKARVTVVALLTSGAVAACGGPAPAGTPETDTPAVTAAASGAAFVPLVGHWQEGPDGLITGDATAWDGQPRADARTAATGLFGTLSSALGDNLAAPGAFPIAISTAVPRFTGGTLSVEFNLIGGETDQIAGLLFNLQPTGEYLYVRYNTRDDDLALWRFANGDRENIVHGIGTRRLPFDTWHTLTLTIDGTQLTAVLGGDLRLDHTLDAPVDGRVGVWMKRDSITAFRNLQAR